LASGRCRPLRNLTNLRLHGLRAGPAFPAMDSEPLFRALRDHIFLVSNFLHAMTTRNPTKCCRSQCCGSWLRSRRGLRDAGARTERRFFAARCRMRRDGLVESERWAARFYGQTDRSGLFRHANVRSRFARESAGEAFVETAIPFFEQIRECREPATLVAKATTVVAGVQHVGQIRDGRRPKAPKKSESGDF
jgi:hypothetical protein